MHLLGGGSLHTHPLVLMLTWALAIPLCAALAAIFLTCEKPLAGRPPASPRPWKQPPASSDAHADHGEHSSHGHSQQDRVSAVSYDAVLALAQEVNVDSQQVIIKPAADEGATWIVQENQRSYPTMVDSVGF